MLTRTESNLEGVLVTVRLAEVFRDLAEVLDGNLVAFGDPSLKDVGGASLGLPEPQHSALEVVTSLRILDKLSIHSTCSS
ncbi:aquaporin SIP2-1 [Pyrus ussuriensis x Pyrus communis]|uniref:Aquaporin SIP2-1 n=1 Tax=Pyrus ussuriensis x Pyrus communis TaxID=2448454 RepID=A0A5N5I8M7_9ROSA|nr:aquaporin SIP2-1 [Pyrus ussuriensis x Pyrus communis]KAB2635480.1 aquaporin SIP2-1 [Pyrus ussuriensis x Pyrus communis]